METEAERNDDATITAVKDMRARLENRIRTQHDAHLDLLSSLQSVVPDIVPSLDLSLRLISSFTKRPFAATPPLPEPKKHHPIVLTVGGGTRVCHTMSIALDLGLPVGGVAQLVGAMEELNAILLNALLARHGSMPMQRDHFWDLPLYLGAGITPTPVRSGGWRQVGHRRAAAIRIAQVDAMLELLAA